MIWKYPQKLWSLRYQYTTFKWTSLAWLQNHCVLKSAPNPLHLSFRTFNTKRLPGNSIWLLKKAALLMQYIILSLGEKGYQLPEIKAFQNTNPTRVQLYVSKVCLCVLCHSPPHKGNVPWQLISTTLFCVTHIYHSHREFTESLLYCWFSISGRNILLSINWHKKYCFLKCWWSNNMGLKQFGK